MVVGVRRYGPNELGGQAVAKLRKSLTYHLPTGIVCFIAGAVAAIGIGIAMGGFLWR